MGSLAEFEELAVVAEFYMKRHGLSHAQAILRATQVLGAGDPTATWPSTAKPPVTSNDRWQMDDAQYLTNGGALTAEQPPLPVPPRLSSTIRVPTPRTAPDLSSVEHGYPQIYDNDVFEPHPQPTT